MARNYTDEDILDIAMGGKPLSASISYFVNLLFWDQFQYTNPSLDTLDEYEDRLEKSVAHYSKSVFQLQNEYNSLQLRKSLANWIPGIVLVLLFATQIIPIEFGIAGFTGFYLWLLVVRKFTEEKLDTLKSSVNYHRNMFNLLSDQLEIVKIAKRKLDTREPTPEST